MIRVKQQTIQDIPIIELVEENKDEEELPMVVFYHGWTSHKESVLTQGYELAKKGIRVVLPEAYLHGEREKTEEKIESQTVFWDVISQNLREFPKLYQYYTELGLADPHRFGASGLSMGGITTCALLTQFDFIKAAVVLMGCPSPIPFTKWLLHSKWADEGETSEVEEPKPEEIQAALNTLKDISLNEQPEKIAGRPVHFWHGTKDESVPFHLTEEFIESISMQPYADQVSFSVGHDQGHKVPYDVSVEMADFFQKQL